jgi:hypothetical protein
MRLNIGAKVVVIVDATSERSAFLCTGRRRCAGARCVDRLWVLADELGRHPVRPGKTLIDIAVRGPWTDQRRAYGSGVISTGSPSPHPYL